MKEIERCFILSMKNRIKRTSQLKKEASMRMENLSRNIKNIGGSSA